MCHLSRSFHDSNTVLFKQLLLTAVLISMMGAFACTEAPTPVPVPVGTTLAVTIEVEALDDAGTYRFQAVVSEGSPTGYEWTIDDGSAAFSGPEIVHTFTSDGFYSVVLLAFDDSSNVAWASETVDIQTNTPPAIASVSVAAAPGTGRELSVERDLVCIVEASDADGDDLTVEITWVRDGITLDTVGDRLSSEQFARDARVHCAAKAFDESSESALTDSPVVTIVNAPPRIINETAMNIVPESPTSGDELSLSVQPIVEDADNDTITLTAVWSVQNGSGDEEPLHTEEGVMQMSPLPSSLTAVGSRISVLITPVDSESGESVNVGPVTVGNTTPELTDELRIVARDNGSREIVPGPALTAHFLSVEEQPQGVDADGQDVLFDYRWERLVSDDEWETLPGKSGEAVELIPDLEASATEKQNTYRLSVAPYDGESRGAWVHSTASITIENSAPIAAGLSLSARPNEAMAVELVASDDDSEDLVGLVFEIVEQPGHGGLTDFDASTGTVTYTPDVDFVGTDQFSFRVSDGDLWSDSALVVIELSSDFENSAPVARNDRFETPEDIPIVVNVLENDDDPDEDPVRIWSVGTLANGSVSVAHDGSALTVSPAENFVGLLSFEYTIRDPYLATATATVEVSVTQENDPPTLEALADATIGEDTSHSVTLVVDDLETDVSLLSVSATSEASIIEAVSASYDAGWLLTVTPVADATGSAVITVTVSDGEFEDSESFTLTVDSVDNDPPVLAEIGDQSATEDQETPLNVVLSASDVDNTGDQLSFSASGNPSWLSFTDNSDGSASLSGTPTEEGDVGSWDVTVTVSDGELEDSKTFELTVTAVNDEPVLEAIVDQSATEDQSTALTINLSATDDHHEGSTLSYEVVGAPSWLSFTDNGNGSGSLIGTPRTEADVATVDITVTVSDGEFEDFETFTLTVTQRNDPPTMPSAYTFSAPENSLGGTVVGSVLASDEEGAIPSYTGLSDQFSVNSENGEITVRAGASLDFETATEYALAVTASDGNTTTATEVTINLTNVNEGLAFEQGSYTFTVSESGSFHRCGRVQAIDEDGDTVTYTDDSDVFWVFDDDHYLRATVWPNYEVENLYEFTVTATDGTFEATTQVTIHVTDVEEVPEVTVWADQDPVIAYSTITFDSTVLDGDGTLEYIWYRRNLGGGYTYEFSRGDGSASATFTAGEWLVWLQVTDSGGTGESNRLTVEVDRDYSPELGGATADPSRCVNPCTTTLSATVESVGNGGLTYSWTDGGTEISTEANPTLTFGTGDRWVYLEVRDVDGDTDTTAARVDVSEDTEPTFTETPDNESIYYGETSDSFSVRVSGGNTPLSYSWLLDGTEIGSTWREYVTFAIGTHEFEVRVTDLNGDTIVYGPETVEVVEDLTPELDWASTPRASNIYTRPIIAGYDGSVTVTAELLPSGGNEPYTYAWDAGGTWYTTAEVTHTFSASQTTIRGSIYDANRDWVSTGYIDVKVSTRAQPEGIIRASSTTGSTEDVITFQSLMSGGEAPLRYRRWAVNGETISGQTGFEFPYSFEEGTHTVTAYLADAWGTEVSASMDVRISDGNTPPTVVRNTPTEDTTRVPPVVMPHLPAPPSPTASYSISDLENDPVDLTVSVTYDSAIASVVQNYDTSSGELSLAISGTGEIGTSIVTVTVVDTDGNSVSDSFTINTEPDYLERTRPALSSAFPDWLVSFGGHHVLPGLHLGDALAFGFTTFYIFAGHTLDGRLVVWESYFIMGCTGTNRIAEMTLEQVQACDPGGYFDPTWAGMVTVQTVEEFVDTLPDAPELRFVVTFSDIDAAHGFALAVDGALTTQQYVFSTGEGIVASTLAYEGFHSLWTPSIFREDEEATFRTLNPVPDLYINSPSWDYDRAVAVATEFDVELCSTSNRASDPTWQEWEAHSEPPVLLINSNVVDILVEQRHGFREFGPTELLAPAGEAGAAYGLGRHMTSGDFDGDGAEDVALCGSSGGQYDAGYLLFISGADTPTTTRYEFPTTTDVLESCTSLLAGDLNGDAFSDLLLVQQTSEGWVVYSWLGQSGSLPDGASAVPAITQTRLETDSGLTLPPTLTTLHLADMDGDGIRDLIASEADMGSRYSRVLITRGSGTGTFDSIEAVAFHETDCHGSYVQFTGGFGASFASTGETPATLFVGVPGSYAGSYSASGDIREVAGSATFFESAITCPVVPLFNHPGQAIGTHIQVVEISPGIEELIALSRGRYIYRHPLSPELPETGFLSANWTSTCSSGTQNGSFAVADINGDGFPDLVVASRCDGSLTDTPIAILFGSRVGFYESDGRAMAIIGFPMANVLTDGGAEGGDFLGLGTGSEGAAIGLNAANGGQGLLLFLELIE